MDRKQLEKVLSSPMDRRDFLKYAASMVVGLIGISRLVDIMKRPLSKSSGTKVRADSGYGSSPYGK